MRRRRSWWLVGGMACGVALVLASGCKKSAEPAPEDAVAAPAPDPEDAATAPEPEEDTAAALEPEADTAAPEPEDTVPPPPEPGVIGAERNEALLALEAEHFGADVAYLSRLEACDPTADELPEDCGAFSSGVVGLRPDGAVALLRAEAEGGCGDGGPQLTGVVASLPTLRAGAERPFADPMDAEDPSEVYKAIWDWLTRLPKAGFMPAQDLVVASVEQMSGIRSHSPLVVLSAPLEGWFINATVGAEEAEFSLVTPDRKTAHRLGAVANVAGGCEPIEGDDGEEYEQEGCRDAADPSVAQVVLSLDRKLLIVTTTMSDGAHCGTDPVQINAWPVPEGVLLPTAPPAPE